MRPGSPAHGCASSAVATAVRLATWARRLAGASCVLSFGATFHRTRLVRRPVYAYCPPTRPLNPRQAAIASKRDASAARPLAQRRGRRAFRVERALRGREGSSMNIRMTRRRIIGGLVLLTVIGGI